MENFLKLITVQGKHYVSLWNHENLVPDWKGKIFLSVNADAEGWHPSFIRYQEGRIS